MRKRVSVLLTAAITLALHTSFRSADEHPSAIPWKVKSYLSNFEHLAGKVERDYAIPKAITLAVAGLESAWGTSELAVNSNNHFGIKGSNWNGPVYCKMTWEHMVAKGFFQVEDCFRQYRYIGEGYRDFGKHLQKERYEGLYRHRSMDYSRWAHELQRSGYATDPAYARKLIRLIEEYRLDLL